MSGPAASGLLKKISHYGFLGTLYLLNNILPSLTELSKTFQTGSLTFSRILLAINRCKSKILEVVKDDRVIQQLKEDLNGRLKELNIILKESEEIRITNLVEKYAKSMCHYIEARFPQTTCKILESFGIFDIELLPMSSSPSFCVHGKNEINFLAEQFFPEKSVGIIMTEWEEFKFELTDIKKKYQLLKENLTNNNLKLKETASEWTLQYIVKGFREDNYIYICELAKIALITPVTNASPERGASAVKGVKSQMRSKRKNNLLNSLLHISINGPPANSKEADQLLERVCNAYANEKHKKIPQVYSLGKTEASSSTQTKNNVEC